MSPGNLLEIRPADLLDILVIEPDGWRYDRSQVVRITERGRGNGMEEGAKERDGRDGRKTPPSSLPQINLGLRPLDAAG